jgi:predicted enzyme related to lactoylglutathione lyase
MRSKFPLLVPGKEGARWKYAFNVNICSEQPERLIRFYADVVGLPPLPQVSPGAFRAGGAAFLVDGHSEVKGQAKEPQRVLLSFSVADVPAEQQRLEGDGVEFVRPATKEPWGGLVATFRDLDGNYCQLVAPKNS